MTLNSWITSNNNENDRKRCFFDKFRHPWVWLKIVRNQSDRELNFLQECFWTIFSKVAIYRDILEKCIGPVFSRWRQNGTSSIPEAQFHHRGRLPNTMNEENCCMHLNCTVYLLNLLVNNCIKRLAYLIKATMFIFLYPFDVFCQCSH